MQVKIIKEDWEAFSIKKNDVDYGSYVEITEGLYERYEKMIKEFDSIQKELFDILYK